MASPTQIVTYSQRATSGQAFRCSARTAAHLDFTKARLAERHPGATIAIIQGCYNTGVAASAGTHDFDAVLDFRIVGLDWWAAQRFLRECGWAAWYRHTGSWAAASKWHIHAVSLGYQTRVGVFVGGQVTDYYAHALGLKGQHASGADRSWFPPNINVTVFDYDTWEKQMSANGPEHWDAADWAAIGTNLPKLLWNFKPDNVGVTMRGLLVGLAQKSGVIQ